MGSRGKCLGEAKESLRKLAKSPSGVKINQMNRMLVIDGEPTIPVSQFLSVFVGAGKDKEKATFFYDKVMARYGQDFNSIDICYFGDHDAIPSILDIAQKNKLKVFIESIYEFDYTKEGIAKLAPKIKDHPALLSWPAILDEVVANDKVSKQAYDRCAWINELDPRHAQFIRNHCVSFSSWGRFGYPGEIVEYHDYTFSSNRGGVAAWAPYMVAAGKVAKERRKPFLAMPQTFSSMQWWSRGPSADEMEASIYLALVNGATIVQFYTFDQAERNLWLRVRRLTKEIKELTPVLATYEEAPAVGVNSPKIQTLVKSHKGRYYLLAVNSSEEPMAVNFDLSALDLPGDATAELMFEDRAVSLKGGALQDSFAGYQRHVYALDKADAGNRSFFDCLIPW